MKTKILENDGKLARVCIMQADGQEGPQLDLCLHTSTKGKDGEFKYWGLLYGDNAQIDLSDYRDWLTELKTQGAIDCEIDNWIRDAISYRLNNGAFKTAQKTSDDGKRLDNLSVDEKLGKVLESLAGDAFKVRTPGESKTTLKTKLASEQDKGKRMGEIYAERRDIETKAKQAKGKDLDKLLAEKKKLDAEFETLIAQNQGGRETSPSLYHEQTNATNNNQNAHRRHGPSHVR